jgi:hypothetical protein
VGVAGALGELIGVLVVEVLGGAVRDLRQLLARGRGATEVEELIDDFAGMVAAGVEDDDSRTPDIRSAQNVRFRGHSAPWTNHGSVSPVPG